MNAAALELLITLATQLTTVAGRIKAANEEGRELSTEEVQEFSAAADASNQRLRDLVEASQA